MQAKVAETKPLKAKSESVSTQHSAFNGEPRTVRYSIYVKSSSGDVGEAPPAYEGLGVKARFRCQLRGLLVELWRVQVVGATLKDFMKPTN